MAKRRKTYKKKSNKCPEPFNTLIDLASGFTMGLVADKMEKKHNYRKRGVPNPYRAASYGFSMGKLNTTEDIIKLGGVMGALGSFDDDNYVPPEELRLFNIDDNRGFDDLGENFSNPINNQYAWRLNCADGSDYGIYPEDFDTRFEYEEALQEAMDEVDLTEYELSNKAVVPPVASKPTSIYDNSVKVYCRVSLLDNG